MTRLPCYVCGTHYPATDVEDWIDHVSDHEPILIAALLIVREAERQQAPC